MTVHNLNASVPPAAAQTAATGTAHPREDLTARHAVLPDFMRFKMHRLGERLDHMQPFSGAYARVLQKLKIAPPAAPQPPQPALGRARSSSLPGLRPEHPSPEPRSAQETPRAAPVPRTTQKQVQQ